VWHRVCNLILLACLFPGLSWAAQVIDKQQRWSGLVELSEPVQIGLGTTLTIEAGTQVKLLHESAKLTVQGRLLVQGSDAAPVLFSAPHGWLGIEFVEAEAGSRIEYARFSGCQQGVSLIATSPLIRHSRFEDCDVGVQLLRESNAVLENNRFSNNRLGLKIGMRSAPQVLNNEFLQNTDVAVLATNNSRGLIEGNLFRDNKMGLSVQRSFEAEVRDNQFINNKTALYCFQSKNTPLIEANLFQGNEIGLSAFSFSYPALRNNRFIANQMALRNDQFGSVLVENNLFQGNDTAIYNNRKSNPKVRNNLFEENRLVLFCDYSSYPEVKQNNLLGNKQAAELGIYQSADWEKRSGSKKLVRQQALKRNSQNPLLDQAPTEFSDRVDLSGNWWGADTKRLQSAGADANLELFFDRRDKPEVSYPGYGEETYRLDLIIYSPWLAEPVAAAGPQESP
jgi:parallel beta-helix repeat protein